VRRQMAPLVDQISVLTQSLALAHKDEIRNLQEKIGKLEEDKIRSYLKIAEMEKKNC